MNDSLDDKEEVYSNESKEKYKENEFHPTYSILLYPLGNHEIEKVIFTIKHLPIIYQIFCFKYQVTFIRKQLSGYKFEETSDR